MSHERGSEIVSRNVANERPFLWGVATSGYQSEGGYNGSGEPQNNWTHAEQSGRVMRTGKAAEFWHRYAEDFDLCRGLGLRAFRLGIEWARVQPSTGTEMLATPPPFDDAAIDAYAERIACCQRAGLEPVVTLQHFTHPAWAGIDAWLEDRTPDLFAAYVAHVVERINRHLAAEAGCEPIRIYITLNEPNILLQNTYLMPHFPGRRHGFQAALEALNRMLAAHVLAYNVIHDLYAEAGWPAPLVTTNTFCSDLYWSDQVILDLLSMRERGQTQVETLFAENSARLHAAVRGAGLPLQRGWFSALGRILHRVVDWLAPRYFTTESFRFFLDTLAGSSRDRVFDFVGLDYYDPFAGHMFRPPSFADLEFPTRSPHAWLMDGITSKWWDWRLLPEGLHFFCTYYAKEFGREILIAENGMAIRRKSDNSSASWRTDRQSRSVFLERHVGEVRRLRAEGCPLIGYLHWSLTDNYEWGSFTPRFGLYSIDYANDAERRVEDHLGDRPSETYAKLIVETEQALQGSPRPPEQQ